MNPKRYFRITVSGAGMAVAEHLLKAEGYDFEPEPFYHAARVLTEEPKPLGRSLAATLGLIYVQDRSSMLPPLALDPEPGCLALDLCAAPGGKTGILAGLTGPEGLVVACEPSPDRLAVLRANLSRTGAVNTATVRTAAERLDWPDQASPYILLDPPCSGWGTTDKHPRAKELWQGARVEPMLRLQKKLLARAAELLAPGGRLVYSTCTTNPAENEAQVRWALEELGLVLRPLAPPPGFVFEQGEVDGVLRVSDDSEGQGFFVACLEKPGEPPEMKGDAAEADLPGTRLDPDDLDLPRGADLSNLPPGEIWDFGGKAVFLHALALSRLPDRSRGGAAWQGHVLGKLSGRELRPAATARALVRAEGGPGVVELDAAGLGELLSGAGLQRSGMPDGLVGLTCRGLALGWARVRSERLLPLGSRA